MLGAGELSEWWGWELYPPPPSNQSISFRGDFPVLISFLLNKELPFFQIWARINIACLQILAVVDFTVLGSSRASQPFNTQQRSRQQIRFFPFRLHSKRHLLGPLCVDFRIKFAQDGLRGHSWKFPKVPGSARRGAIIKQKEPRGAGGAGWAAFPPGSRPCVPAGPSPVLAGVSASPIDQPLSAPCSSSCFIGFFQGLLQYIRIEIHNQSCAHPSRGRN